MVLKQHAMLTVLAAVVCLTLAGSGVGMAPAESDSAATLAELGRAMKAATKADEKRDLLADLAKISDRHALDMAIAAADDEELAESAREAAGQIAQALTAPEQPRYIRRLAFIRWARCLTDSQVAEPVVDALRGDDIVLGAAAMSVVDERGEGPLIELVAGDIGSFSSPVQHDLMRILTSRSDEWSTAALLGMTRDKDKKLAVTAIEALGSLRTEASLARLKEALGEADADIRTAALRGIAKLGGVSEPDEEAQATLLEALQLVTSDAARQVGSDEAVAAAVQIAQTLAASHPEEVRQALKRLQTPELSEAMQERVEGALLLFTIDQLPNLAKGAKASSPDGLDIEGGSSSDQAAIDGDAATYWDEIDGQSVYRLRVDLPQPTEVSALSIVGWGHHSFSPKDFKIICDDETVKTVTNATYANNRLIVPFPRTRCTSVELQITAYYGGSPAVRELGIFDAP